MVQGGSSVCCTRAAWGSSLQRYELLVNLSTCRWTLWKEMGFGRDDQNVRRPEGQRGLSGTGQMAELRCSLCARSGPFQVVLGGTWATSGRCVVKA